MFVHELYSRIWKRMTNMQREISKTMRAHRVHFRQIENDTRQLTSHRVETHRTVSYSYDLGGGMV